MRLSLSAGLFLWLAGMAAAQDEKTDWSQFTLKRPLSEAETTRMRERIAGWISRSGISQLNELAKQARIKTAEELPVYHVAVETLEETRRLERVRRPHVGGRVPPRKVNDADPWGIPLPEFTEFKEQSWRIPVEGSMEVSACKACKGKGATDCKVCEGDGMAPCAPCKGEGSLPCPKCVGTGLLPCRYDGNIQPPREGNRCRECGDEREVCHECRSGRLMCQDCLGLRDVGCDGCNMKGKLGCATCAEKGKLAESLEIIIGLTVKRAEQKLTSLDEKWDKRVAMPDKGWISHALPALEEAARRIPDDELLTFILEKANQERANREHIRGQRVNLLRIPVIYVKYEAAGSTYELIEAGSELMPDRSPVAQWVSERAETALRLNKERKYAQAKEEARLALKVDGTCAAAATALKEAERGEKEEREKAKPVSVPSKSVGVKGSSTVSDSTCIWMFIGFVVSVLLLLVIAVKMSLTHRV
ncbi:MAG: hypothetical protein HYY16_10855 [Planctomycetes bacterium]|nr:hypothetical protein [Planctomycetota bacterium]